MHRIFGITEVVDEIVAHLDDPSLAVLARTAKLFEQPAYGRLYFYVDKTQLRVLSQRMIAVSGDNEKDAASRSRCLSQARLVRGVNISSSEADWNEVQAAMTLLRRPFYPFPCLRSLAIFTSVPAVVELVDVLVCPALEMLTLVLTIQPQDVDKLPSWEGRLLGFLEGLPEKANHIRRLHVSLDEESNGAWRTGFEASLADALGSACRGLPLANLMAGHLPITPKLLQGLAYIETLEVLDIAMPPFNVPLLPRQYKDVSLGATRFCALKQAYLQGTSVIGDVVKCLDVAEMEVISVDVLDWGPYIATLLDAICSYSRTIQSVRIQESRMSTITAQTFSGYTIPRDVFSRLSCCSSMKTFYFDFDRASTSLLELLQPDVEHLAESWTGLEELFINYGWNMNSAVPLTIEAFIPFSQHCPHLNLIAIEPLSSTLDVNVPRSPLPSHHWGYLSVGYPQNFGILPRWTSAAIAQFLDVLWSDMFIAVPNAFGDSSIAIDPGTTSRDHMNDILKSLRNVRTMRPGSRWQVKHQGESSLLSNVGIDIFDSLKHGFPDSCPWDMIA